MENNIHDINKNKSEMDNFIEFAKDLLKDTDSKITVYSSEDILKLGPGKVPPEILRVAMEAVNKKK